MARRLTTSGVIDVVATAAPGIDDIVVLGKIKQLERSGEWDVIVVDGPAAGHAITFLTSAAGLLDAVRGGPVRAQAQDVVDLLGDPERCQVVLVTLPETTPVNEVVETAYALEDRVGVRLGPVSSTTSTASTATTCPIADTASTSRGVRRRRPAASRAAAFRRGRLAHAATTRSPGSAPSWRSTSGTCRCCRSAGLDAADVARRCAAASDAGAR